MSVAPYLSVFRDTRTAVSSRALRDGVRDAALAGHAARALVRAGELESAIADAGDARAGDAAARLTDALAMHAVLGSRTRFDRIASAAAAIAAPATLVASPPEGFSYYALHPLDFADASAELALLARRGAAVVGLRSIGTTLSAVVVAALVARGVPAARITVRPRGDPSDRTTDLSARARAFVRSRAACGATFFVVDEGPGLSGSSLLSAAEAIGRCGVASDRIVIVCSRPVDPKTLRARDAAQRWRYRTIVVRSFTRLPADAEVPIDAGLWRAALLAPHAPWPATWPWMERVKRLAKDGARVFKFEGLGRYGDEAMRRARLLADTGFGLPPDDAGDGFFAYPLVRGARPLARHAAAHVERLAEYCAVRARAFAADDASTAELARIARHNARLLIGAAIGDLALPVERPVLADARMMPHEWIAPRGERLRKLDGTSHGDDAFHPGPVDIAWDLAGAIVEWRMEARTAARFLDAYRRRSGDDARARIGAYTFAYAMHRAAFAIVAESACVDVCESARWAGEARRALSAARCGLGQRGRSLHT